MTTVPNMATSVPKTADDGIDRAWIVDKAMQVLMFVGGISAIVFILGIFAFIAREGLTFVFDRFSFVEFFTSIRWAPTSGSSRKVTFFTHWRGRIVFSKPTTFC